MLSRYFRHWLICGVCLGLLGGCGGVRPDTVGNYRGAFAPCPEKPNCVNSQAQPSDKQHYIAPFELVAEPQITWDALQNIVQHYPRSKIITRDDHYLYAEFTSRIMRFVDDTEFYLHDNTIAVRSASRLGKYDFDVNRDRINTIRKALQEEKLIK